MTSNVCDGSIVLFQFQNNTAACNADDFHNSFIAANRKVSVVHLWIASLHPCGTAQWMLLHYAVRLRGRTESDRLDARDSGGDGSEETLLFGSTKLR
jgi:hypothetical protein